MTPSQRKQLFVCAAHMHLCHLKRRGGSVRMRPRLRWRAHTTSLCRRARAAGGQGGEAGRARWHHSSFTPPPWSVHLVARSWPSLGAVEPQHTQTACAANGAARNDIQGGAQAPDEAGRGGGAARDGVPSGAPGRRGVQARGGAAVRAGRPEPQGEARGLRRPVRVPRVRRVAQQRRRVRQPAAHVDRRVGRSVRGHQPPR